MDELEAHPDHWVGFWRQSSAAEGRRRCFFAESRRLSATRRRCEALVGLVAFRGAAPVSHNPFTYFNDFYIALAGHGALLGIVQQYLLPVGQR